MTSIPRLAEIVAGLSALPGVSASLATGAGDGLLIQGSAVPGVPLRAMAALVPSLYKRVSRCSAAAGYGAVEFVRIEGESGDILACGRRDIVLAVAAVRGANLGRLRLDLRSAADKLS